MKHTLSLFLLLAILVLSCSKEESEQKIEPTPNQVTLIFKNHKSNIDYKIGGERPVLNSSAGGGFEIATVNNLNMLERFKINFDSSIDTVIIPTTKDLLEVKLTYKAIDELTYHFQKGDTVVIEYEGLTPMAKVINRTESADLTNIQMYVRESFADWELPPTVEFTDRGLATMRGIMKKNPSLDLGAFIENYKIQQMVFVEEQYQVMRTKLDEYQRNNEITDEHIGAIVSDFYWNLMTDQQKPRVRNQLEKYTNIKALLSNIENEFPELKRRSDSLLNSVNYQRYLYKQPFILYDIETLKQEGKGYGASTSNYISTYDSIRLSSEFTGQEKLILQFRNIDKMFQNSSFFDIEDRLIYLTRFKNDFQDTTLFNQLVEKYDVKFEIDDSLELEDENGNTTTLSEFIASKKGKVIYLDFWASWCAPCIREIPSSKTLKREVAEQDIEFLYLSTDRKMKPWKQAQAKHDFKGANHFRITNAENSLAMNELEVIFIPRYMIFDKNGQLVNKDAPRPSEKENLISELTKYLNQE